MPVEFTYKARDLNGVAYSGVLRLENADAVKDFLTEKKLIPIAIDVKTDGWWGRLRLILGKKTSHEELILFTRKLNALYKAGIPITGSLGIIADQQGDEYFADIASKLRFDLEQGYSFSDAVAQHPGTFGNTFVSAIKVAEQSGRLDVVLDKLATALERDLETREQIKTAVRYPILVVCMVTLAFFALVTFVVPKFADFYAKYNAQLPLPTRILIQLNHLITQYWPVLLVLVVLAVPGIIRLFRVKQFRCWFDGILLKLPVFGKLLNKIYISRFSHLLGVTFGSGAPLLAGLDTVKSAVGNRVIESEIDVMRQQIQQGNTVANIRHLLPHFPNLALSMIQVGLESGSLEFMLQQVSSFFDREIDYTTKRLLSLIEPFLILFLGTVVLCLALAIFLPMWNLIQVFRPH
jgi:MSHA biogenesis protein MshG